MRQIAVCYLIKDNQVLLLRVHYPNGKEIWNGVSGWVEGNESPKQGILREIKEEIGVKVTKRDLKHGYEQRVKEVPFTAFIASNWQGSPKASEESIRELRWFYFNEVPYEQMFDDNKHWLPELLEASKNM